jgi:beta-lactamase regulating signal transducer with metallopeptidase domain/uncharacterized protein involved in exopolysaccharide biosynthesis
VNTLWAIIHHPFTERVGWILLHSLWQGALIGAGFALLRLALRKQSAQARYLAGCVCLTLMLCAPLLTLLMGPAAMEETSSGFSQFATATPSATAQEIAAAPAASSENRLLWAIQSAAIFLGQAAPWLTAAWLCGVAFSSCKLMRGFWWVQTIRKKETNAVNPDLLERLDDLRRRLSISRPVRLLKSALIEVPTVVGWLRPVILLPASSLAGLTPGQLEAILVHELAHVRRFDYLVNIFQCLIETVMFYHPVVWWISRCIREEGEHCCDDLVVKVCGNRVAYARALATLEGLRVEMPQLAFAASGGSLLNRVRRLLGATGTEESVSFRQIGGLALLGVGLVFILLGIYLNLQKPMYRAAARIKVAPETTAQIGAENGRITLTMSDPYLTQNVCEEIQSEPILTKVVEDLGLANEWGKRYNLVESPHRTAEIIAILKGKIGFRPIRNTMFLEISCVSENPEEAKAIANGVARAYQQFRVEQLQHGSLGGLKVLESRWNEQEQKVRAEQTNVDRLREQFNIPNVVAAADSPAMLMSAETLRKLEGMRIELEAQVMREETLLEHCKSLPRAKLVYALPTAIPDPLLNSLLEQKNFCEQALVVKQHEFGAEHPEVVKLKSQLEDLKTKVDNQLDGIFLGMDSRVSAVKEQLKKLKDEVENAKAQDIATAKETQPFWEAKRKLEDLQRFSQVLAMKVASENIEAALPKKMFVEVMEEAIIPWRPIYPNRGQAAALIVLGILLDLGGLRMIRTRPRLLTPVLQPG